MTRPLSYYIKNSMTESSLVHLVSLIQLFVLIVYILDTPLRMIFKPTISLIINVPPGIWDDILNVSKGPFTNCLCLPSFILK